MRRGTPGKLHPGGSSLPEVWITIRRLAVALAVLVMASGAWAGKSHAAMTTVGAPLPMPISSNITVGCSASCLFSNPTAPIGTSDLSPVSGMIVRWHLLGAWVVGLQESPSYRLRVLSPQGTSYLAAGTSAPAVPQRLFNENAPAVETFPAHIPIVAGQLVGLELENQESAVRFGIGPAPGLSSLFIEPSIADGEVGMNNPAWGTYEFRFPFNAEVLPPPSIKGISPGEGSTTGGTQVMITGENFAEVEGVTIGSAGVTYTVASEDQITAIAPGGMEGSAPVTVKTVAGTATASQPFVYESPPTCKIPKLKGRKLKAAKKALKAADCKVGKVTRKNGVTSKTGKIVKQSPKVGKVLAAGSKVNVVLG